MSFNDDPMMALLADEIRSSSRISSMAVSVAMMRQVYSSMKIGIILQEEPTRGFRGEYVPDHPPSVTINGVLAKEERLVILAALLWDHMVSTRLSQLPPNDRERYAFAMHLLLPKNDFRSLWESNPRKKGEAATKYIVRFRKLARATIGPKHIAAWARDLGLLKTTEDLRADWSVVEAEVFGSNPRHQVRNPADEGCREVGRTRF